MKNWENLKREQFDVILFKCVRVVGVLMKLRVYNFYAPHTRIARPNVQNANNARVPATNWFGFGRQYTHWALLCRSFECSIGRLRRAFICCCLIDSISIRRASPTVAASSTHPSMRLYALYDMRHRHFNIVSIDWTYILMEWIQSIYSGCNRLVLSHASCNSDVAIDVRPAVHCVSQPVANPRRK